MSEGNTYNKLNDKAEVEGLLLKLIQNDGKIIVKQEGVSNQIFLMIPKSVTSNGVFTITARYFKGALPKTSDPILVLFHFLIEDKKVVGSGELKISELNLLLKFQLPIFFVQRRENFRLRLPSDYIAKIAVPALGSHAQFRVTNISASGLLCEDEKLPTTLSVNHRIAIDLRLPGKDPIKIQAEVRRAPTEKNLKLGLRFVFDNKQSEREMLGLVMELYRRFFSDN